MMDKTLKAQQDFQGKCAPGFVNYFNASCLHKVLCKYYGESYERAELCCEGPGCYPSPNAEHSQAVDQYVKNVTHIGSRIQLTSHRTRKTYQSTAQQCCKSELRTFGSGKRYGWKEERKRMGALPTWMHHHQLFPIIHLSYLWQECIKHILMNSSVL